MPYVTIRITDEPVSNEQKQQLISQTTEMLQTVLDKDPNTTFVVIEQVSTDDWGIGGQQVSEIRKHAKKGN